jgi:hypothetical protein
MPNQFIMAIGLDYGVERQGKETPSVKAALHSLRPSLTLSEIEKNKATLTLDDYDAAEELIKAIYEHSSNTTDQLNETTTSRFNIILTMGDTAILFATAAKAANILASAMQKSQEQASTYPVQVYITKEIYETLRPHYKDLYHSAIEIASTFVHQRFSENAQRCFVVSPIGQEGTRTRQRADFVFERYIKPACETTPFRPVRGEMMRGNYIMSELLDALQSDPMVIVYLGPPKEGWNPNVMFELGTRMATGAPYLVIKDSTSDDKPYELPFDLKDNRVVDVPEHEETNLELAAIKIRTLRDHILETVKENQWDYLYPGATVDMKIGDSTGKESRFTEASRELETLFELKAIIGKGVSSVIEHLLQMMPSCQRQPLLEEQQNLIGKLVVPALGGVQSVHATIPIVFQRHQKYKGRAFLPIIVRYNFNRLTNVLRLRILYVDVTSATKLDEKGYYVCALTSETGIDLIERYTTTQPRPSAVQKRGADVDVDKIAVAP